MKLEPITPKTEGFWREVFMDGEVQLNLFRPPVRDGDFQKWAYSHNRYTIFQDNQPIGIATLIKQESRCFFGYAIARQFRGKRLSHNCLQTIEEEAVRLGCRTLTTNVLKTNTPSIKSLEKTGFRKFYWFEKNL